MERELPGFADGAHEEQESNEREHPRPCGNRVGRHHHAQLDEIHRAECDLHEQNAEQHSEVADARCDERLFRRLARRYLLIVKADQEVRAKPDALPEHIELEEVERDHEPEHRRREQRHECEEPPHARVVFHVAGGVDIDEQGDERHDDEHHRRERVDEHAHLERNVADLCPQRFHHIGIGHRDLVVHDRKRDADGEHERRRHHRDCNRRGEILL